MEEGLSLMMQYGVNGDSVCVCIGACVYMSYSFNLLWRNSLCSNEQLCPDTHPHGASEKL